MMASLFNNEEALFILCGCIAGVAAIVVFGGGGLLVQALRISAEARLKQQMLQRGMSPVEIEQVLSAGTRAGGSRRKVARDYPAQAAKPKMSR